VLAAAVSLIGGFALLLLGAELLVRGASGIALRLGVPPLLVGLTIVSMGTSAPELVVSLKAALDGLAAIALGNVIGSNICNIALILGFSALIRPLKVHVQLVRNDMPIALGSALVLTVMLADGHLGRPDGVILVALFAAYLSLAVRLARREVAQTTALALNKVPIPPSARRPLWLLSLGVATGIAGLTIGARMFVSGAVSLAGLLGVSEAVIGLTVVAVGTSLPEFATSLIAAVRGNGDIAVGNVVGSNIFNILGIAGITSALSPLASQGIGALDLVVLTVLSLLMLPVMRSGFVISRWEGGLLLLGYGAYVVWLLP
jgi:cation:H+ antiporter